MTIFLKSALSKGLSRARFVACVICDISCLPLFLLCLLLLHFLFAVVVAAALVLPALLLPLLLKIVLHFSILFMLLWNFLFILFALSLQFLLAIL